MIGVNNGYKIDNQKLTSTSRSEVKDLQAIIKVPKKVAISYVNIKNEMHVL